MGTLTAGLPRLAHYCEHKLPTSCRLTSIGECCACYDNRAHSTTYSTYIDGIGFVSRGTRWQRYCWFCKEFWENRVNAAGLRPAQTKVPHEPDQTAFLERWYEFHNGYRVIKHDDGSEERIAVLGEDLREVAPGCLPRTLEELRTGRDRSGLEDREREARLQRLASTPQQSTEEGLSLDETLDQMFQAASEEERSTELTHSSSALPGSLTETPQQAYQSVHAQAITAIGPRSSEYQARRVAALRDALQRMRHGIERVLNQLRDLGQQLPDHVETSERLSEIGRTLDGATGAPSLEQTQQAINSVNTLADNVMSTPQRDRTLTGMRTRVDEARQHVDETRRNREQAAADLDLADQEFRASQVHLRQVQNEQRTAENYLRLFGTREEMIAQGEDWVSPIGGLFDRAMERARAAEEVRREQRTLRRVLEDEEHGGEDVARRLAELESRERDVWGVPRGGEQQRPASNNLDTDDIPLHSLPVDGSSSQRPPQDQHSHPHSESSLRGDEVELQEYYLMLRRQQWSQQGQNRVSRQGDNARPRLSHTEDVQETTADIAVAQPFTIVAGPPGQQLDETPYINNDRGLDAVFVLSKIAGSDELRNSLPVVNSELAGGFLERARSNVLNRSDRSSIEELLQMEAIIWSTQLPAERNRRRRARGETVSFTPDAFDTASQGTIIVDDVEIMAECFQMSRRVREQSGLTAPEQLAMLYRLQRGERTDDDRVVLSRMLQNNIALTRAREVHERSYAELNPEESSMHARLESERRAAARQGDHSRAELDAQRRATRDVTALAAGRAAMALGPSQLLERMANRDEETRAAYQRLQDNIFVPEETMSSRRLRGPFFRTLNLADYVASQSASDEEDSDDEAKGLDAKNSGRPDEPLTEEQMTVLLDCRVCYTQKANVVTVPCGHLAMCEWCSEQHSPTMVHDHTKPRRAAACPVCRKQIRQKFKVIRG